MAQDLKIDIYINLEAKTKYLYEWSISRIDLAKI